MRSIKFRAQQFDHGKYGFQYGSYVTDNKDYHAIVKESKSSPDEMYNMLINPKTLGQFTGLQDKNGVGIYEGDIVSMHTEYIEPYPYHNQGVDDFNVQRIGEVRIQASKGTVIIKPLNVCNEMGDKTRHKWNVQLSAYRSVVIGNIHSNPELLEK